ncbi:ComEC/Rec2 family competence protein [Kineococcus gynurae]|uniref:ComEC/Rec2 family competence protein n=1 Tax=Kineococcus gynurae TaxID=452979 RepID=A0ABV5LMW3_9ACTN
MSATALEPGRAPVPTDLRLVTAAVAGWACAAWAHGRAPSLLAAVLGVVSLGVLALGWHGRRRRRGATRLLPGVLVILVLVSCLAASLLQRSGSLLDWAEAGSTVQVQGEVRSDPRPVRSGPGGAPRVAVELLVTHAESRGRSVSAATRVLVLADAEAWTTDPVVPPGTEVAVPGRLLAGDDGDEPLLLARGAPVVLEPTGWVGRQAQTWRAALRTACAGLPADARGLLPGLVVGDTSGLPPDLDEAMTAVGLSHLTAVSGSNTSLVVGALVLVGGFLGLGRRARLVLAGVGLAGFVVLVRPEPSVLRAAVMGSIGLIGVFAGRPTRGVPVLAAAVLVLLVVQPGLAREFGFVLSVLATASLLLLARPGAELLVRHGWPRWAAFVVAVPVAAQAACGPVVVLLSPMVNLLAVPANVAVTVAVAPATVLGLAVTVLALVAPGAAAVLVRVPGVCAQWIAFVARTGADAPTSVAVPAGWWGVVVVAVLTVLTLAALVLLVRARGCRRWVGAGLVTLLVAASLVRCSPPGPSGPWPVADWVLVGCDVGQGDAVVLRSGPTSAVLVDAGPDDVLVDGCLDRLGVDRLDAVVLTHLHADHVDGLAGAVRGRTVGAVWTSPLRPAGPALRQVDEEARDLGLPLSVAREGLTGSAGSVSWRVLAPPASVSRARDLDSSEVNDSSVTLLAEVSGVRVLLLGDLEPGGQRRVLAGLRGSSGGPAVDGPVDGPVDVVKVAHHGSARQLPALYAAAAARVAVVEVGAVNDYGHPAPETTALLERLGVRVLRTDRDGDVAVAGTSERLRLLRRGPDPRDAARRERYSQG